MGRQALQRSISAAVQSVCLPTWVMVVLERSASERLLVEEK
jgi:hypothetical protein